MYDIYYIFTNVCIVYKTLVNHARSIDSWPKATMKKYPKEPVHFNIVDLFLVDSCCLFRFHFSFKPKYIKGMLSTKQKGSIAMETML